jgi:CBS domain-containing protein
MIDVLVHQAMADRAPVVGPTLPIADAAERLRDPRVPALVVRDDEDTVTGIVTDGDVVAAVAEHATDGDVASIMSSPVVTVTPTTTVGLAADRMRKAGVTLLPVVDETGDYLGLATRETLAPHVARHRLDVTWDRDPLAIDREPADQSGEDPEPVDTA